METESLSVAKRRVVNHLKRSGPEAAGNIADELGLTPVAIRQHLQGLEVLGLVEPHRQPPRGRGRPSIHWSLTAAADELFPDHHAKLAVELFEAVRETFGEEGLARLLEVRERRQKESLRGRIHLRAPLGHRLEQLAAHLSAEGFMAELVEESDGYLLVEHHCPICEAARTCDALCHSELAIFRHCLGEDVEVERIQHVLDGDDRCVYRIHPRSADA